MRWRHVWRPKNQVQALKAVGYAWTAAWVAGIAVIVPWIGWLVGLAGAIYSIYLLYLGLPHTMKNPPEKSLAYTVVTAIIAIVLSVIMGAILAGIAGVGALTAGALGSTSSSKVRVDSDSRLGQIMEFGKRAEEAGRQLEQARASGDPEAEGRALGAVLGAMAGATGADGAPVEVVEPDALRAMLPESMGSLRRTSIAGSRSGAMGMQMREATAQYEAGDGSSITVEIKDMAAMSASWLAGAFGMEQSSETDSGFERTYSRDGRLISEEWTQTGAGASTGHRRKPLPDLGSNMGSIDDLMHVDQPDRQVARCTSLVLVRLTCSTASRRPPAAPRNTARRPFGSPAEAMRPLAERMRPAV